MQLAQNRCLHVRLPVCTVSRPVVVGRRALHVCNVAAAPPRPTALPVPPQQPAAEPGKVWLLATQGKPFSDHLAMICWFIQALNVIIRVYCCAALYRLRRNRVPDQLQALPATGVEMSCNCVHELHHALIVIFERGRGLPDFLRACAMLI